LLCCPQVACRGLHERRGHREGQAWGLRGHELVREGSDSGLSWGRGDVVSFGIDCPGRPEPAARTLTVFCVCRGDSCGDYANPRGLNRGAFRPRAGLRAPAWRRRQQSAASRTSPRARRRHGCRRRGLNCNGAAAPPRRRVRARDQHAGAKLPAIMRSTIPRPLHLAVVARPLPWDPPASHVLRWRNRGASRMSALGGDTCFSTWPRPQRISSRLGTLSTFAAVRFRSDSRLCFGASKSKRNRNPEPAAWDFAAPPPPPPILGHLRVPRDRRRRDVLSGARVQNAASASADRLLANRCGVSPVRGQDRFISLVEGCHSGRGIARGRAAGRPRPGRCPWGRRCRARQPAGAGRVGGREGGRRPRVPGGL